MGGSDKMGAAVMYFWLLAQRNRNNEGGDETAFAKLLAMMYMMIGVLLVNNGVNNYGFPTALTMFGWMAATVIVGRWGFKQDDKWNESSAPSVNRVEK